MAAGLSTRGFPMPNPHVGCVIVRDHQVIGRGYHDHAGGDHAEIVALKEADGAAGGSTVYVTLEPCKHHGRTPPCVEALIAAKVARVVIAIPDPTARAGGGADLLRQHGIQVDFLPNDRAEDANRMWLHHKATGRPYILLKAAIGLDGRLATCSGESKWITGEDARRAGHRLRALCGAVLVGAQTFLTDSPQLTARIQGVVNQPRRLVWTSREGFSLPEGFETIYAATPGEVLEKIDGPGLLVEGGARTLSAFVEAGLYDELHLFVAPKVLGDGPAWFSGNPGIRSLDVCPFEFSQIDDKDLYLVYRKVTAP